MFSYLNTQLKYKITYFTTDNRAGRLILNTGIFWDFLVFGNTKYQKSKPKMV